ncbi:MAG TPA: SdrD B-like domain-containing protein [Candidatus Thermoplasmatota archaeon]|nr:SdrD B-like domain-containing protein [Candidatus Thermoplasmatota archaeon]
MRKRAQFKMPMQSEPVPSSQSTPVTAAPERKRFRVKKNWWMGVTLIAIFFLVLFMNSYFNIVSNVNVNPDGTTLADTYYLSGPDPYYNMRLVDNTVQTGRFPYFSSSDPLLAYPFGKSGGRAPLLVMSAIGFSKLLTPFMSEENAVGYAMQFVPALFGALLIFPVYFIGKILFGKKAGLIAALLIALIPIHISSGHGSAYALFDHDSFNLLLYFLTFLFLIKSFKEKDTLRRVLYALLAGVPLAALSMVWVEAQFLYTIITIYAVVQLIIDLYTNKVEEGFIMSVAIALFTGFIVSWPVSYAGGVLLDLPFFLAIGILIFGGICILFKRKKIPWVLSLPFVAVIGVGAAVFLYVVFKYPTMFSFFAPLNSIADILYGAGIYGSKVSLTIAEAGTYNMSRTVMSYGPALYWLAWAGFVFLIYQYVKQKGRRDYLMILTLFVINIWLTSTAGRFLNDMVPFIALLSGWIIWFLISKIDYKQMARNIRNAGGGFRGIRKGVRIYHIFGVLFIAFLILIPNGYLALDAAVPSAASKNGTSNMKYDFFGKNHSSAFGSSTYKEQYWVAAYQWLHKQDANIAEPKKRPGYISWWDYGFYEVAVGGHPTVADNFQDGIPPASNFHTAKSEKEGVAVWIVRLLEGNRKDNNGVAFSDSVIAALQKHLGNNNTTLITSWMLNPTLSPSQGKPIGIEYDKNLSILLSVGEQYPENAYYHDIEQLLNNTLTDEQITWLYHDIQQTTGYSIRYYGVEGYDEQIFNIFAFLGDKSNILTALRTTGKQFFNPEDDFIQVVYTGYTVNTDGSQGADGQWTAKELNDMPQEQRNRVAVTGTSTVYKADYFNTMFYRAYVGAPAQQDSNGVYQIPSQQIPCYAMKHFVPAYVSPYPYYGQGRSAVVIAKYYEGAFFNGSISCNNTQLPYVTVAVLDEYGFPHDYMATNQNGSFNLIVPGGNITLIFTYANDVFLKSIKFNSTSDVLYAPVTDAEAMRMNGSKYSRAFSVQVNLSTLEGFVYQDNNNNNSYEPAIDTPLSGITVRLDDYYFGNPVQPVTTDAQGHYIFRNLYPSKYNLSAVEGNYTLLNRKGINIEPNNNTYNISKPKLAGIKGVIYQDSNGDKKYTAGEEESDVHIQLTYTKLNGAQLSVANVTTGASGSYAFPSLIPGEYTLNATKVNASTGYLDFRTSQAITLTVNKTSWVNISLTYAPVNVSGSTRYEDAPISGIPITFAPDKSVANNTATKQSVATSNAQGTYTAALIPGTYNVTVKKTEGSTTVYTFTGKLLLFQGQGTASYNLSLTKVSVTVSGSATYNGSGKANMTIFFTKDLNIKNNTAITTNVKTNANGMYTIELTPGSYNVTVEQLVNESGQNVTYIGTGGITASSGEAPKVFNIVLTREQST